MTTRGRGNGPGGGRSGGGRGGKGGKSRGAPAAAQHADPALELHPVDVPPDIQSFTEWPLSDDVQAAILAMGITKPTPIQALAIGPALEGRDVIAKAETGTGKTLAFGAPMVSKIDPSRRAVLGLVLCPTRELAQQVAGVLEELGRAKGLKVALLVGGDPIPPQIRLLQTGTQIVVGTPGRVLDLMGQRFLSFPWTEFVVLDEADEMLEIGFLDDVEKILLQTPEERQTLLFSATFPPALLTLARKHTRTPAELATARGVATTSNIRQSVVFCRDEEDRTDLLRTIIRRSTTDDLMLCFCDRRTDVDKMMRRLERLPEGVKALHGGYDQASRFRVMSAFREGSVRALLATDVASRGLDVQGVTHVINCGVPREVSTYTHRIGRTGRAGRQGHAITIVAAGDVRRWNEIVRHMNWEVEELEPGEFVRLFGAPQAGDEREPRRHERRDEPREERAPREERGPREERAPRRGAQARDEVPGVAEERPAPERAPRGERAPRRRERDDVAAPQRSNEQEPRRAVRAEPRAESRGDARTEPRPEARPEPRSEPRARGRTRSAPREEEQREQSERPTRERAPRGDERAASAAERSPTRERATTPERAMREQTGPVETRSERPAAAQRPARPATSGDPERDARRTERSALRRAQSETNERAPAGAARANERSSPRERDERPARTERSARPERARADDVVESPRRAAKGDERSERPVREERPARAPRGAEAESPAKRDASAARTPRTEGPARTDGSARDERAAQPRGSRRREPQREPVSDTPRMAQRRGVREAAESPEPAAEPEHRVRVRRDRPEKVVEERTSAERPARSAAAPASDKPRERAPERARERAPERARESASEPAPERRRVRSAERTPRATERGPRPAASGGFGDGLD
jgi:superfamily II DNA/RNA helicase